MNVDLADAYAVACRQLGEASVQIELMGGELDRVTAERDEAGARIVALTTQPEPEPGQECCAP